MHNFNTGWWEGIEFLVVSDAAGRSKPEAYQRGPKALLRLATSIMMDQIRSLRTRAILERLISHNDEGVFLQTGNTCEHVLKSAGHDSDVSEFCPTCLSEEQVILAAEMDTTIKKLTAEEFERLFRHGFEVADYTLYAYYPEMYPYVGYQNSRSVKA